ncbi:MAG: ComF family protein [Clostridia bacterium]|nr:ComF family protein [Clostridia bacterium]
MMKLWNRILAFFFPPRCLLCGAPGYVDEDHLCADCAKKRPEKLYRFFALKVRRSAYTLECRAPMRYRDPFRRTLQRFKFRDETGMAAPLAIQMKRILDADAKFDCIVPVPISRERMRERGYNQSALLAEALSKETGIPCRLLLEKTVHNQTQHRLSAKEREKNVRGVYRAEDCTGLRILLVDDIVTTGATVRECSRTLYAAGAAHIDVVCCALVL